MCLYRSAGTKWLLLGLCIASLFSAGIALADTSAEPIGGPVDENVDFPDLTELSLEDLMNIEVTSVSKQKQRISEAPAAISVISQEDIRRSGMTSIPELLRLAPGVTVQQLNANVWQIGVRGFTQQFNNKLLVLQDGRTLYNRLFGGVYWHMQDYLLQDLERIEVIRGPGGTLWGANAVAGVINITSKSARDTQGMLFSGNLSNQEALGGVRYGTKLQDDTFVRVYGKYRRVEDSDLAAGGDAEDGWEMPQAGFRLDRYPSPQDQLTLQGDVHRERAGPDDLFPLAASPYSAVVPRGPITGGGNLLARWTHTISSDSDYSLQAYFDHTYHDTHSDDFEQNTADIEFQHRFRLSQRNELIYGLGFRYMTFNSDASEYLGQSLQLHDYQASAFVQDDFTVIPERLHFIFGTKLENNSDSGWNVQPSARIRWTPDERRTLWAAVARAVRNPSVVEQHADIWLQTMPTPSGLPARMQLRGDSDIQSESLMAYELGYRFQPHQDLSIDIAGFLNVYDDLAQLSTGSPSLVSAPEPYLEIPLSFANEMTGETYGMEVAVRWRASRRLHVSGSYSLLFTHLHVPPGSDQSLVLIGENGTPRNQAQLHLRYELSPHFNLDASAYYTERLDLAETIPSYVRVDLGLSYHPNENTEFRVGVRNLLDDKHREAAQSLAYSRISEVPRTVYAQLVLRF